MPVTQYPDYGSLQAADGSELRIINSEGAPTPAHGTWVAAVADGRINRLTLKLADGKVYSEAVDPATGKRVADSMMFFNKSDPAKSLSEKKTPYYDRMSDDQREEGAQLLGAALGSYMSPRPTVATQKPEAKPAVAEAPQPQDMPVVEASLKTSDNAPPQNQNYRLHITIFLLIFQSVTTIMAS
jgi:hypothetical protein